MESLDFTAHGEIQRMEDARNGAVLHRLACRTAVLAAPLSVGRGTERNLVERSSVLCRKAERSPRQASGIGVVTERVAGVRKELPKH